MTRVVSTTNGASSGTYTYDGNGLRVKKVSGSTTTVYIFSGSKVIAEYVNGAAPSSPTTEYIYSGSALLAKIDSSGAKYYHQDHLSNRRVAHALSCSLLLTAMYDRKTPIDVLLQVAATRVAGGPRFILFFIVDGNVRPNDATLAFYCTPMSRGWPTLCGFVLWRMAHQ